jgi:type VI protein secretion system component VasA
MRGDKGTEVYLTLVNLGFRPTLPPAETLTVHLTCTNRDLAGDLPFTNEFGELSLESGSLVRRCVAPTKTIRHLAPRLAVAAHLASHAQLSFHRNGRRLQEILKLISLTIRSSASRSPASVFQPAACRTRRQHGIVLPRLRGQYGVQRRYHHGARSPRPERFLGIRHHLHAAYRETTHAKET